MNQRLELPDKYFKAAIIKLLEHAIMNFLETNEKLENLSTEIKSYKNKPIEIIDPKSKKPLTHKMNKQTHKKP